MVMRRIRNPKTGLLEMKDVTVTTTDQNTGNRVELTAMPKEKRQEIQQQNAVFYGQKEISDKNKAISLARNKIIQNELANGNNAAVTPSQVQPTEQQAQSQLTGQQIQEQPQAQIQNTNNTPNGPQPIEQRKMPNLVAFGQKTGIESFASQAVNIMPIGVKLPETKKTIAQIIDQWRIGISGKKPLNVQQAEGTFNDAMTTINQDITDVKNGQLTIDEAQIHIALAQNALSSLKETQKGAGKENLRYWIDNGKEIETEIILFESRLNSAQRTLNSLEIQMLEAQVRANLGF